MVKKINVGNSPNPTHKINNITTLVFSKPDLKSSIFLTLPFNSKVFVINHNKIGPKFFLERVKRMVIFLTNIFLKSLIILMT